MKNNTARARLLALSFLENYISWYIDVIYAQIFFPPCGRRKATCFVLFFVLVSSASNFTTKETDFRESAESYRAVMTRLDSPPRFAGAWVVLHGCKRVMYITAYCCAWHHRKKKPTWRTWIQSSLSSGCAVIWILILFSSPLISKGWQERPGGARRQRLPGKHHADGIASRVEGWLGPFSNFLDQRYVRRTAFSSFLAKFTF